MNCILEIACFNIESVRIAAKAGADRIELCENYLEGGVTPSENLITEARNAIDKKLFVMIRPRSGNFNYTSEEIEQMKLQINFCKTQKCDGVVFGILNSNNTINKTICKELVELAKPLECTFHRAFDEIENSNEGLEDVIECGFNRILTSGKKKNAIDGAIQIRHLIKQSTNRIIIMPGGKIRSNIISNLSEQTNAAEFHSAAIIDNSIVANAQEIQSLKKQLQYS